MAKHPQGICKKAVAIVRLMVYNLLSHLRDNNILIMEVPNMEHRLMTEDERVKIHREARRLRAEGKESDATALRRTIPMSAFMAKFWKEHMGKDFLIKGGWNLAEAEAEYGPDWLDR
jgi:hypothetical protein